MGRAGYIRKRLLLMIFVLFGVTLIIFSMVRVLPGDPAFLILGDHATDQNAAALREQLGLNRPLPEQYWLFISGFARGSMGDSLLYRQPVSDLVVRRVPVSIGLAVYAMALAAVFTLIFGVWSAVQKGRLADHTIRLGFLFVLTTPNFWLGILLIQLLALGLHWFPVAGFGETTQEHVWYLFLPAFTLGLQLSAVLIRNLRGQIIQTLRADYVRTARAKGLAERLVVARHGLKNALIPIVTIVGVQAGYLLGGAVLTETVFAWPGVGTLMVQGILARDFPLVQGCVLVIALSFVLINLAVDLLYAVVDPRIRYE